MKNKEVKSEKEEEIIEVDVEDIEDIVVETEEEPEEDSEVKRRETIKEEILSLISSNKTEELVEKYLSLNEKYDEINKQSSEYLTTAQRVQANFENYKKRVIKDQEWSNFQNKQKIIQKFLTLFDDLERTNTILEEHPDVDKLKDALALIMKNLRSTFDSLEVEIIEPEEEIFNPQFHEAVYTIEKEGIEKNQIIEVLNKGFKVGNIVIRPAKVAVGKLLEEKENN
ncbi:MAG: nucleotide exchange factor GrpE [Candidatus Heimdallarchaeaceae archaeon]|jgi:molecular chaperone GrpE